MRTFLILLLSAASCWGQAFSPFDIPAFSYAQNVETNTSDTNGFTITINEVPYHFFVLSDFEEPFSHGPCWDSVVSVDGADSLLLFDISAATNCEAGLTYSFGDSYSNLVYSFWFRTSDFSADDGTTWFTAAQAILDGGSFGVPIYNGYLSSTGSNFIGGNLVNLSVDVLSWYFIEVSYEASGNYSVDIYNLSGDTLFSGSISNTAQKVEGFVVGGAPNSRAQAAAQYKYLRFTFSNDPIERIGFQPFAPP